MDLDAITDRYTCWLLRHPWTMLGVIGVVLCLLMAGLGNFVLGNDYNDFFDEANEHRVAYERVAQDYANDDMVFFVLTAQNGEIFDRDTLAAIAYLTEHAWHIPHAYRVDSLVNFQHIQSSGDDIEVRNLIESPEDMTEEALAEAKQIALQEPLLLNRLVKEGRPVTGVNVTLKLPEGGQQVSTTIVNAANALKDETMSRFPCVDVRLTGLVPLNEAFLEGAYTNLFTLAPVLLLVILVVMALLLQSIALTFAVVVVVVSASLCALGALSWLHYETSGPITVLPLIVMTLAVADCVHILVSMQAALGKGMTKAEAITESMRINMAPVFVTSATTAVGFLCMNITSVPMLRVLGNFTAVGVLLAYLLAISLLPLLAFLLPFHVRIKRHAVPLRSRFQFLAEFVLANKGKVTLGLTLITCILSLNLSSIRVNNQFIEWFDKTVPIRRDTEYAMENLTGIYQLAFDIPAGQPGDIHEPEYLAHLENFAQWMLNQDGVVHVSSITHTMKRLNQAMHGDNPEMYGLPGSRALAAQYLLLYELSLPMGVDLNMEVNMDKSATRVVATTRNLSTERINALIKQVALWQSQNFPPEMRAPAVGLAAMFAHMAHTMMDAMFLSAPVAVLLVSLALMITLRSVKYGLISLIPNLMPMFIGFGIWGALGRDMGFTMTTIVATSIGIVVDDTVHFLSKYLRARRTMHLSPEEGIRYAFRSVGKAMWVTSLILVAGFSIMAFSSITYISDMGLLTSIIVTAALAGDFLLLPAILVYTDHKKGGKSQ